MSMQSTIRAFGNILTTYSFGLPSSKSEEFAQKRFLKKMEVPNDQTAESRKQKCFSDFIDFDRRLPGRKLYRSNWYKARLLMHDALSRFRLAPLAFTNGSELTPTFGRNSIESKLMRSQWDCTPECFDLWAISAFETLAIKRAARKRFARLMSHDRLKIKQFHTESWNVIFKDAKRAERPFLCFKRMLSHVTVIAHGSRFSTVRKNNEKDRPIDLQPLCNMLVQRRIGNGFRNVLLEHFGVDLDHLASKHGRLVCDLNKATVDLQNASDSIGVELVSFLFPKRVLNLILDSRTSMTMGLDDQYHVLSKVSSMGNGFTFELMTLILHCLGRQLDEDFSVFGDDIIIARECYDELTLDLLDVGFVVNQEKSFSTGPFRESCGYNFFQDEGYVKSFDFQYPTSLVDCVTLINKAYILSKVYPTFVRLYQALLRASPKPLQGPVMGPIDMIGTRGRDWNEDLDLSQWIWTEKFRPCVKPKNLDLERITKALQFTGKFDYFYGLELKLDEASPVKKSLKMKSGTGKYMMYLHGGRATPDAITGSGNAVEVLYLVLNGSRTFRVRDLLKAQKALID
jgi:hypothetical protein